MEEARQRSRNEVVWRKKRTDTANSLRKEPRDAHELSEKEAAERRAAVRLRELEEERKLQSELLEARKLRRAQSPRRGSVASPAKRAAARTAASRVAEQLHQKQLHTFMQQLAKLHAFRSMHRVDDNVSTKQKVALLRKWDALAKEIQELEPKIGKDEGDVPDDCAMLVRVARKGYNDFYEQCKLEDGDLGDMLSRPTPQESENIRSQMRMSVISLTRPTLQDSDDFRLQLRKSVVSMQSAGSTISDNMIVKQLRFELSVIEKEIDDVRVLIDKDLQVCKRRSAAKRQSKVNDLKREQTRRQLNIDEANLQQELAVLHEQVAQQQELLKNYDDVKEKEFERQIATRREILRVKRTERVRTQRNLRQQYMRNLDLESPPPEEPTRVPLLRFGAPLSSSFVKPDSPRSPRQLSPRQSSPRSPRTGSNSGSQKKAQIDRLQMLLGKANAGIELTPDERAVFGM
eukprot:TRINITY_DN2763_c0_g1_i2.p2 TRINITY_DN2763_c0_g1~~TRINITY_DN2763_c0_g1_i2.p2  ORF type:complete len:460 (+),score=108.39 TRINITY_DN2763_c0_g1_i2:309-1688(+)